MQRQVDNIGGIAFAVSIYIYIYFFESGNIYRQLLLCRLDTPL